MEIQDPLSTTFAALAHPARRTILARLAAGDATVNELAAPFDMSLPAVSRHIRVLERAGLIAQSREAQFRRCTLTPGPIEKVASWTDQYRSIWETRLDRMAQRLGEMRENEDES